MSWLNTIGANLQKNLINPIVEGQAPTTQVDTSSWGQMSPDEVARIEAYDTARRNSTTATQNALIQNAEATPDHLREAEAAYLAANPDVAAAVQRGEVPSGLAHYAYTGYNEGRLGANFLPQEVTTLKQQWAPPQSSSGGLAGLMEKGTDYVSNNAGTIANVASSIVNTAGPLAAGIATGGLATEGMAGLGVLNGLSGLASTGAGMTAALPAGAAAAATRDVINDRAITLDDVSKGAGAAAATAGLLTAGGQLYNAATAPTDISSTAPTDISSTAPTAPVQNVPDVPTNTLVDSAPVQDIQLTPPPAPPEVANALTASDVNVTGTGNTPTVASNDGILNDIVSSMGGDVTPLAQNAPVPGSNIAQTGAQNFTPLNTDALTTPPGQTVSAATPSINPNTGQVTPGAQVNSDLAPGTSTASATPAVDPTVGSASGTSNDGTYNDTKQTYDASKPYGDQDVAPDTTPATKYTSAPDIFGPDGKTLDYLKLAASGLTVASPIVAALINSKAASDAAKTQADAQNNATQLQRDMWGQTTTNMKPYLEQGGRYSKTLEGMMPDLTKKYDMEAYLASPEYQVAMAAAKRQQESLASGAAAKGAYGSGNMANALQDNAQYNALQGYGQGLNDYWSQNMNAYNMYSPLAASGQNAAANLGGMSQSAANQIGTGITGAGNATAQGQTGSATAIGQGIQGASNALLGVYGANQTQQNFQDWLIQAYPSSSSAINWGSV